MSGLNKAMLIGNLGKDPEMRTTPQGIKVVNLPIATSETFKNQSGERETRTEWHNIVMWRQMAETANSHLKKGMQLYIEGKITTRSWLDQDGKKRYTTEIVAETFSILGHKSDNHSNGNGSSNTEATENPIADFASNEDPDLPF